MGRSKEKTAEINAINLSHEEVITIINNYVREKNMSYAAFERELGLPASTVGQIKLYKLRSYQLWRWADAHREFLIKTVSIDLQTRIENDLQTRREKIQILSSYFKVWRLSHGLSQAQVAQACNCSRSLIAMSEFGSVVTIDGMLAIMKSAFENIHDAEIFQIFYNVPEEKRKLFIQLCKSIANTLAEDASLEEGGD